MCLTLFFAQIRCRLKLLFVRWSDASEKYQIPGMYDSKQTAVFWSLKSLYLGTYYSLPMVLKAHDAATSSAFTPRGPHMRSNKVTSKCIDSVHPWLTCLMYKCTYCWKHLFLEKGKLNGSASYPALDKCTKSLFPPRPNISRCSLSSPRSLGPRSSFLRPRSSK